MLLTEYLDARGTNASAALLHHSTSAADADVSTFFSKKRPQRSTKVRFSGHSYFVAHWLASVAHWLASVAHWLASVAHWLASVAHWLASVAHWLASVAHWLASVLQPAVYFEV